MAGKSREEEEEEEVSHLHFLNAEILLGRRRGTGGEGRTGHLSLPPSISHDWLL